MRIELAASDHTIGSADSRSNRETGGGFWEIDKRLSSRAAVGAWHNR